MKILLNISLLILAFGMAAKAQTNSKIKLVELSKVSRGYEEHISISPDSLHVSIDNHRGQKPAINFLRKVTAEEWTNLSNVISNLTLKDLPSLPSPTMKRASDGAMHATITITTADGKSYAHGYDDENPHEALKPLLKQLRAISGAEEKP